METKGGDEDELPVISEPHEMFLDMVRFPSWRLLRVPTLCRCTEYSSVIVAPRRILHVMRSTSLAPGPPSCIGRRVRVGLGASELCASQALTQTAHARERVAYAPLRWL